MKKSLYFFLYLAAWDANATPLSQKVNDLVYKKQKQYLQQIRKKLLEVCGVNGSAVTGRLREHFLGEIITQNPQTSSFKLKNQEAIPDFLKNLLSEENVTSVEKVKQNEDKYTITLERPIACWSFEGGGWTEYQTNKLKVKNLDGNSPSLFPLCGNRKKEEKPSQEEIERRKTEKIKKTNEENQMLLKKLEQEQREQRANSKAHEKKALQKNSSKPKIETVQKNDINNSNPQNKKKNTNSSNPNTVEKILEKGLEEVGKNSSENTSVTCCQKLINCIKSALALISSPLRQTEYQPISDREND